MSEVNYYKFKSNSKMTINEKCNRQKEIIDEVFASLKKVPLLRGEYINFLKSCLSRILKIELEYYDLPEDTALVDFESVKNADWSSCLRKNRIYEQDDVKFQTPVIITNMKNSLFKDIFSLSKYRRLYSAKIMMSSFFHEIDHLRQHLLSVAGYVSYQQFRYAKETIVLSNSKTRKELYNPNHDSFSIEAEANYNMRSQSTILGVKNPRLHSLNSYKSIKESSTIVTLDEGITDRDTYLDKAADKIINSDGTPHILWTSKILLKEYNIDGTPIRFSDLIRNYNNDIADIKNQKIDKDTRKVLLADLKQFYLELFNKKIRQGDRFELLEAVNTYGDKYIKALLNDLSIYNLSEKKRKLALVKTKLADDRKSTDYIDQYYQFNNGFIANPFDYYQTGISTDELIDRLNLDNVSMGIRIFLASPDFLNFLPIYGYFLQRDGTKITVLYYIEHILIPKLQGRPFRDFKYINLSIIMTTFLPVYEIEAKANLENINRKYQKLNSSITNTLDLEIFKNTDDSVKKRYNIGFINDMDLVHRIVNGDESAIINFEAYYQAQGNDYYERIKKAALCLKYDTYFNPRGKDYLLLFNINPKIRVILMKYRHKNCEREKTMQ